MTWAIGIAVGAVFVAWAALNKASEAEKAKDHLYACIDELHARIKALDPQFDDERALHDDFNNDRGMFTGMSLMELERDKRAAGKRTLSDPLLPRDR